MNETNKNKAIQILENLDDRLYIRMKIIDNRNMIMILFNLGLLFILISKTQFIQKEIICLNISKTIKRTLTTLRGTILMLSSSSLNALPT